MLTTIMSYPERGKYGDNKYRGNCSGELIKDLILHFGPKHVSDFACGSNTTGDVCSELGISSVCMDLNPAYGGFDLLNDEIPVSSDFIFFHPPYHNIIQYSYNMWGKDPDERDLSRCRTYEEFIHKINSVNARLITSLRKGGYLAILIGDVRENGNLYCPVKDMTWYGKVEALCIKTQHNCFSDRIKYYGNFIAIYHEYLLILKREDCYILPIRTVKQIDFDLRQSTRISWHDVVLAALEKLGGKATLDQLYSEIEGHGKTKGNRFWQEKIRQVLQQYEEFKRMSRGVYALSA